MTTSNDLIREARELIAQARDEHFEDMWADGSPCCPICNCSWPCDASRLADALEVAEAHAAARGRLLANNPLLESYAEALAEARTETADALARAERAEADNAALLAELERLRAVAALVRNTLGTVSYGRDGQLWWHELQCPSAADYFNECSPNCTKLRDALEARDE